MTTPSLVPGLAPPDDPALFAATLRPHRSLPARGFTLPMLAIGAVSFASGVAFVSLGAWPVFGFFGLDVALVYLAFRRNYRDARAFEVIDLSRGRLLVRQVAADGATRELRFNPRWTRLDVERRSYGVVRLALASGQRRVPIARFLGVADREALATALGAALAAARLPAAK